MENCIFCKLIKRQIPARIVYEDNDFISFLDIFPVSDGHVLIIPKKHVVWMHEAPNETVAGIFLIAKKLMLAVKNGIGCDYVQLNVTGIDVSHFHVHLIPRYLNDGFSKFPTKEYEKDEHADKVLGQIVAAIPT